MNEIKFIFFDINGVLCYTGDVYDALAEEFGVSVKDLTSVYEKHASKIDSGKMSFKEFWEALNKSFGAEVPEVDLKDLYIHKRVPVKRMHKFAEEMSGKTGVGVLSNLGKGSFDDFTSCGAIPTIKWDAVVVSSEVGFVKPQKGIFEKAEKMCGFSGEEILLIDDYPENIRGAVKFGWSGIRFDPKKSRESLAKIQSLL